MTSNASTRRRSTGRGLAGADAQVVLPPSIGITVPVT